MTIDTNELSVYLKNLNYKRSDLAVQLQNAKEQAAALEVDLHKVTGAIECIQQQFQEIRKKEMDKEIVEKKRAQADKLEKERYEQAAANELKKAKKNDKKAGK